MFPFSIPNYLPSFCSLLREISQVLPQKATATRRRSTGPNYPSLDILNRWIAHLHKLFYPLPLGTTAIVFRMLFPEEDTRRKYDMQETRLAQYLAECFGVDGKRFQGWFSESSSGCLGNELRLTLERICPVRNISKHPLQYILHN